MARKQHGLRKLNICNRSVFRKRRVHPGAQVSFRVEEFTCDGETKHGPSFAELLEILDMEWSDPLLSREKRSLVFGISKKEDKISDYFWINPLRPAVGNE